MPVVLLRLIEDVLNALLLIFSRRTELNTQQFYKNKPKLIVAHRKLLSTREFGESYEMF